MTRTNGQAVLVTGATGGQGGAVARTLLARGFAVRALVRDPTKPQAAALAALGAEIVVGDLGDLHVLRAGARGASGVFSVQPADMTDPRPEIEVRQGKNVAAAAEAEGVDHLVYSSVAAHRGSGVAHFEAKADVEAYIDALGVPATVLRPVFFMENWRYLIPAAIGGQRIGALPLGPDTTLQMIALIDIGRIAADVFDQRPEYLGRKLDIAGDELTVRRIAEVFTDVDGIPTRFERPPIDAVRAEAGDVATMFDWLDTYGYRVDIPALRGRFPQLLRLEDWLREERGK
ncbi:NmrA family NAD(P)-binding protein [Nocardia nova]|uniref:NmrA family NAD(P)-binding protein n=1 Tax=Nocardia nova TaxID=37330 RepID=UPI00189397CD|nr:NmrA family NAD(P)-binding protein [Nocardia nova]MBF6150005.1 NmrA family NAD(P)-binding protein [Nocardia nova]MDN2498790.1 NAD-dependent epimerase/dehydratase family protein [Nocardia nova]